MSLTLVSHTLCPYVQRAAIALAEKGVPYTRTYVDLANKPDWFLRASPLGKTPVLLADDQPIFESAVILEYLEDSQPRPLHPEDPLRRAQHRSWIEFGSAVLNDIAKFYSAKDQAAFDQAKAALEQKFARLEEALGQGPYFGGNGFSLVDAVFGPVFRYFDTIDRYVAFDFGKPGSKLAAWRQALADRPSVRGAVGADYGEELTRFLVARQSVLSHLIEHHFATA